MKGVKPVPNYKLPACANPPEADPNLSNSTSKNKITHRDYLTGQQEAEAFDAKEYVKLHQSTLRKVDVLANILERTLDGSLTTNTIWKEIYGGYKSHGSQNLYGLIG